MISPGRAEPVCTALLCFPLCVCVCESVCAGIHVTCTRRYRYIYIYICVCVCVCESMFRNLWGVLYWATSQRSVSVLRRQSSPSKWKAGLSLSARLTQLSRETCSYYCGCLLVRGTQTAQNKAAFDRNVEKRPRVALIYSPLSSDGFFCTTNMKESIRGNKWLSL